MRAKSVAHAPAARTAIVAAAAECRTRRRAITAIRRGFVDTPEGQLHYYEAGAASLPALILLHSTPNARLFHAVLPLLGEQLRAIAMDTPGYGDSTRPPVPYTEVAQYSARVAQLLDGLDIEHAHLLGHMTGAVFAAETAAAFPERVERLALVEFLDWAGARAKSEQHHVQVPYARPAPNGGHLLTLWERYSDMLDRVTLDEAQRRFISVFQGEYGTGTPPDSLSSGGFGQGGGTRAASDGIDVYGPAGWQAAAPAAIERYATWERVPQIRASTLVLCGDSGKLRSGADPLTDQARLVEAIPDARAGILHGVDHAAPFLAPGQYAHALLDFFVPDAGPASDAMSATRRDRAADPPPRTGV